MAEQPPQSTMDQAKDATRALVPTLITRTNEIAPTAGAAQVQALVQARFVVAMNQRRNLDIVRQELKKECSRPNFALEQPGHEGEGNSALYRRPVGNGQMAEGLGIRFAEVAERCMGNIMSGALTIQEDDKKKSKYCFVLDLESNASWEDTIDISKVVERLTPRRGDVILSQRTNSTGQITYTVQASEDALNTKEGAMISKKLRTLILRLVPGDIQDECIRTIKEARMKGITDDPDASKKRVIDGMFQVNVSVTMLEEYLGHPVGQCTPAEILNLQGLYAALRDGITTWKDVMENVDESRKVKPTTTPATPTPQPTAAPVSDKGMDAAKAQAAPVAQPVSQPQPPATPVQQPVAPVTAAEIPAQPAETQPAPPTPPAAQPTVQPQAAPEWATPQAEVVSAPPLETPPVTTALKSEWSQLPAGPNGETVWVLNQELKGGKGKIVKDIQFPAVLTRDSEAEAWTPEQLTRAQAGMAKVNQVLGKSFVLESSIKAWFNVPLEALTSQAMSCVVMLLENWK